MKHIQKELQKFQTNPPENCEGGPVSEFDLFKWELKITGPDDSPYEGGKFTIKVEFPPDYPFKPPKWQQKFIIQILIQILDIFV